MSMREFFCLVELRFNYKIPFFVDKTELPIHFHRSEAIGERQRTGDRKIGLLCQRNNDKRIASNKILPKEVNKRDQSIFLTKRCLSLYHYRIKNNPKGMPTHQLERSIKV